MKLSVRNNEQTCKIQTIDQINKWKMYFRKLNIIHIKKVKKDHTTKLCS